MTSMALCDFQSFCNKFMEQCITQDFDRDKLGWKPCVFSIQDIKDRQLPGIQLSELLQRRYGGTTLSTLQREVQSPISVGIYTESRSPFSLRRHEAAIPNHVFNVDYEEFKLCSSLARDPEYDCTLLARSEKFFNLTSYYANTLRRDKEPQFSNFIVPHNKLGYEYYLDALLRFYPHYWLGCYIDWGICNKYQMPIQDTLDKLQEMTKPLVKKVQRSYKGVGHVPVHLINSKEFSSRLWSIYIPCPGVVIGSVPALIVHGAALTDVMTMYTGG